MIKKFESFEKSGIDTDGMDQYIMSSKKQTETLEEINVAIKRAFDQLGILPQIKEAYGVSNYWALCITYN